MTKAEIIDSVYDRVGGFSKKEAAEVVEVVFETMKDTLTDGEKIKISGFGNFVVRHKKERTGRNPQTGEPIPISARRVLTFKPSQVLKGILNPHRDEGDLDAPSPRADLDSRPRTAATVELDSRPRSAQERDGSGEASATDGDDAMTNDTLTGSGLNGSGTSGNAPPQGSR